MSHEYDDGTTAAEAVEEDVSVRFNEKYDARMKLEELVDQWELTFGHGESLDQRVGKLLRQVVARLDDIEAGRRVDDFVPALLSRARFGETT